MGEKRKVVRVGVECTAIYRIVPQGTPRKLEARRSAMYHIPSIPASEAVEKLSNQAKDTDPEVKELLLWLDWKISFAIKTLSQKQDESLFPHRAMMVDLSASGMMFLTPSSLNAGEMLEFQMILPVIPFREMTVPGQVTWCMPIKEDASQKIDYMVGILFCDLAEDDRECIIHYVVQRQLQVRRESIR